MTTVRSESSAIERTGRPTGRAGSSPILLPAWVTSLMEGAGEHRVCSRTIDDVDVAMRGSGEWALCSVCIRDAAALPSAELRSVVARSYAALFRAGDELAARNRVRMWSFIPGIHATGEHGLSTYEVFNQGRFEAFMKTLGSENEFANQLPTATGVGHEGSDLTVHCLTARIPGIHIENPRQVPAYRYSARYGPRPPCFARGTIVPGRESSMLLIGGTASVRDEVSMHPEDLGSQLAETLENLRTLVSVAHARVGGGRRATAGPLEGVTHLRAYCSRAGCERLLREELHRWVGPRAEIEFVSACLCREELMVEVEGVVDLRQTV